MKQITITEDLYDKILKSNPILDPPTENLSLIEQLKTELYTNENITL